MKKVIYDCDNTMGVPGRDVDDGLALLYLLGRKDIQLEGVTTTYGNSSLEEVFENTKKMFKELNIKGIPLMKGAKSPENRQSEASEFLAREAAKNPGEITLLATGALTNLYGAYELDNSFFSNLKEIVLMGGITEPLIINGVNLEELNFSCDSLATYTVLNSSCHITILTGHTCLQGFFGEEQLDWLKSKKQHAIYDYIRRNIEPWYSFVEKNFGVWGFYNWDIVSAVYITNPELFEDNYESIISTEEDLRKGYLRISSDAVDMWKKNIPRTIKDVDKFKQIIFDAWETL